MGQGLGLNSPVQLLLGKENYEALIVRHGQWVRWRVATKCPCVHENSMQPDIHCPKCAGLGLTYGYQDKATVTQTIMVKDVSGIIQIDKQYEKCPMIRCYDNSGIDYPDAQKQGNFIILNSANLPNKGVYITVVMTQDILQSLENATLKHIGNNWYRVEGLRVGRPSTQGLYHTVPSDIETISQIKDDEGNEFIAAEIRQDCVYIPSVTVNKEDEQGQTVETQIHPKENLTATQVEFIPPFTFVILNQNLSKSDAQIMQECNGDAVLTFSYAHDVSNDDVITVLSGTYTAKSVITKKEAEYDVIPAYFVDKILCCVGKGREYIANIDFILCGTNYIKWLCQDCPDDGEGYSITYRVFPTYKVVKSIPQIRTSENQQMPKKAIIKLYDTYGEARGVNRR